MELIERGAYLSTLADRFRQATEGMGHTVFLMGEAGIGKTSLVNQFLRETKAIATVFVGACDSLFTPRPLGPYYDVASQMGGDYLEMLRNETDRNTLFTSFLRELNSTTRPVILVFEDIHWADEATSDLIKFLARRINRLPCLFLLTFRDDELHANHPLKNVFGQLPPESFSKIPLNRLSRQAVDQLARARGHDSGDKVYALTGGNPFYVGEVLENSSQRIPDRVKDSVLAVFQSKNDDEKALLEFFSILPSRIAFNLIREVGEEFWQALETCLQSGVLVDRQEYLSFKHELFRIAIEESLPAARKKALHGKMVQILTVAGEKDLPQLVHHARLAEDRALVARLAPQAAKQAAAIGAHIEASRFYSLAIENSDDSDPQLVELHERHAYECYLTNQIGSAIQSQQNALSIWRQKKNSLKEGNCLRFLSRLYWFEGEQTKAFSLARQSIEVLENGFPTRERALAYSNFSQLNMLDDNTPQALEWGNKAIALAGRMEDPEILSHALNNTGTAQLRHSSTQDVGEEQLRESLFIALENGLHEHVSRAYTNLSSVYVLTRQYKKAAVAFDDGLRYCEERDLNSWTYYMLSWKARMLLETGVWKEAEKIAEDLAMNSFHPSIVRIGAVTTLARICIRVGDFDKAEMLIKEGRKMAMPTGEAQRIVPVLTTALELSWTSGGRLCTEGLGSGENEFFTDKNHSWLYSEFVCWMKRCGLPTNTAGVELTRPYDLEMRGEWEAAALCWREAGCVFEQALALAHGHERQQKEALSLLDELGATATSDILRMKMKKLGISNIPRGPRESTRSNAAQLTSRQMDVLSLLAEGLQNQEIAEKLFISPKTVDHHVSAILLKLDVNTRAKAVKEGLKLGILK